ncbi:MAG: methanogenesis marker 17 protein [Methanobacteriaceae archaeon]|nr:methanogenesis marker 17 protein [Methanobacteriaceae archaeon]
MFVECYDKTGAEVYDMILRTTLQDLQLARSVHAIKVFIEPREAIFIAAVKIEKTSTPIYLSDMASYESKDGKLYIDIDNENYLPNLLKKLWLIESRNNISQPDRYKVIVNDYSFDPDKLIVSDPSKELKRKIYDALFRIMPEGFRLSKNTSKGNIISLISSDEIFDEKWNDKLEEVIEEVKKL